MKSSIKVDFQDLGKGLEPVINVQVIQSEDPRDKLVKAFFEKLGGESNLLNVVFGPQDNVGNCTLNIYPIVPEEFKKLVKFEESFTPVQKAHDFFYGKNSEGKEIKFKLSDMPEEVSTLKEAVIYLKGKGLL